MGGFKKKAEILRNALQTAQDTYELDIKQEEGNVNFLEKTLATLKETVEKLKTVRDETFILNSLKLRKSRSTSKASNVDKINRTNIEHNFESIEMISPKRIKKDNFAKKQCKFIQLVPDVKKLRYNQSEGSKKFPFFKNHSQQSIRSQKNEYYFDTKSKAVQKISNIVIETGVGGSTMTQKKKKSDKLTLFFNPKSPTIVKIKKKKKSDSAEIERKNQIFPTKNRSVNHENSKNKSPKIRKKRKKGLKKVQRISMRSGLAQVLNVKKETPKKKINSYYEKIKGEKFIFKHKGKSKIRNRDLLSNFSPHKKMLINVIEKNMDERGNKEKLENEEGMEENWVFSDKLDITFDAEQGRENFIERGNKA